MQNKKMRTYRMPAPSLPQISLVPQLLPSALGIAAVVVAVHISLAKVFAKKFRYKVDPGQVSETMRASSFVNCFQF